MSTTDNVPLADDTLRLIADARQESIRMRHEYIGTEHLGLALAHTDAGGASSPLAEFGVDAARAYQLLENTVRGGRDPVPADLDRPFTSRTKQAFTYAGEAAQAFGQSRVGVGHVLYGLMREGENIGAQVLHDQGLTAELVENKIRRAADHGGAS
jgi:ATP-dependent Clp protease ATP-binding subunit ClpC